jgi:hypothetical protein
MVFSLDVQPTREDGWDRDEIVRVESSLTPPALPRFLDDFDPELERETWPEPNRAVRKCGTAVSRMMHRERWRGALVVIRYVGDRDDVDAHAVSLVQWAGSAGQLRDRDQIRALAVQNIDVCRRPRQAVALRDDESTEAM